jgi:hypothetical protein
VHAQRLLVALAFVALGAACAPPGGGRPCRSDDECPRGESCRDRVCVFSGRYPIVLPPPPTDGGGGLPADAGARDDGGLDAGPSDAGYDGGYDAGPWWNPAWPGRVELRLINVGQASDLVGFAVPVRLADHIPAAERSATDVDVRFTESIDSGELTFELERAGQPDAVAWVRVPLVPARTADSSIWLYWGNPLAPSVADTTGAVWTDNYEAVLHLSDEGAVRVDATGNGHGIDGGPGAPVEGALGGGLQLDGGAGLSLFGLGTPSFPEARGTVSFWLRKPAGATSQWLFDSSRGGEQLVANINGAGDARLQGRADGGVTFSRTYEIDDDEWEFLSFDWNGSTEVAFRVNGSRASFDPLGASTENNRAVFGANFTGALDEIRVSSVRHSGDWTRATWHSQEGSFLVEGAQPRPPDVTARTVSRVAGALVEYDFSEGAGTTVANSGSADGLDLTIGDATAVEWVGEGLWFQRPTLASTEGDTSALVTACAGGDATFEGWFMADNPYLDGPARVFTFSLDSGVRNFTLGQSRSTWMLRLVTSETDNNGSSHPTYGSRPATPIGTVTPGVAQHVVFVREGGVVTVYVDGSEVTSTSWTGDYSNWGAHGIGVGNEFPADSLSRSWVGGVYLAALYCRALTNTEVSTNYAAGP